MVDWRTFRMRLAHAPEFRLASLGFALNAIWEAAQTPLYADADRGAAYLLWTRLHCTAGDVLILLAAFVLTSIVFRSRDWPTSSRLLPRFAFVMLGLVYTTLSERFNVGLVGSWGYATSMPLIRGVGLAPLLQWLVVPSVLLWFLRSNRVEGSGESVPAPHG